jgi:hypothetical protein
MDDRPTPQLPATQPDRLAGWRTRLLDLSARNRLLNLRTGGRQALAIDCPEPARLEDLLAQMRGAARPAPLRFRHCPEPADPAVARAALARRELLAGHDEPALTAALTEIYRTARAALQEGGANTLFLTIGALLWRQKGKDIALRAPVILVPVVLERPSPRAGFSLRTHDDETRLNTTMLEMLRQDYGLRFPALEAEHPPEDEAGLDVAGVLATLRAGLDDLPGWQVTGDVALTNLSFTKFLMWKDLGDRAEALRRNEVARRLLGFPAGMAEPATATETLVCPLEADNSQLRAVAAAASGQSFVLIGPPGTGKSQTIANIIANTIAQGRSVLFVAEKRAALEVVQRRLREVNLADFCLDLFSARTSKPAVLEQLNRARQAQEAFDPRDWHSASEAAAALAAELDGYVHDLHRPGRNGWTVFRAIGCVLHADADGVTEIGFAWPDADTHDEGDLRRLAELVEEAAATRVHLGAVVVSPALAGIAATEWSPAWQAGLLEAAGLAAARLGVLPEAAAAAARALGLAVPPPSRPALAALDTLAGLLLEPAAAEGGWALAADADATMQAVRIAAAQARRHRELRDALQVAWRPEVMALPLLEIEAAWQHTRVQWAIPRMLDRLALRRRLAAVAAGTLPADCAAELERLAELQRIEAAVAASAGRLIAVFGPRWAGLATDFARLEAGYAWAGRLRAAAAACAADPAALPALRARLRQLAGEAADLLAPTGPVGAPLVGLRTARAALRAALRALAPLCGTDPAAILAPARPDWAPALAAHLGGWEAAAPMLRDWCTWRGVVRRMDAAGLAPLARALESGLVAPAEAAIVFEANYARWWIGRVVARTPRLRGFVAARHQTRIERFRVLDTRLLGLAGLLARARLAAAIPDAAARGRDPEYAVLARELAKRQRHLPVRQLSARMPRALRQLTPCLMMSPLSVAQYLPSDAAPFDLVIFDEASQIPPWDAIGVIGRGRQVVVVGDPQQLPPTRFFQRQLPEEEDGGETFEIEDLDSILDECLGAGIPAVELTWHYRSRHESLIAFSNQTYYGGRLVTFPSPVTSDTAVSFRHVPDGVYARAGARTNEAEACAVVAETLAVLRRSLAGERADSVGIVTFNAEQQLLIEDKLDAARREDPSLEPFFADDAAEPVLVKNLESVQGEERDIMLFSLTYGPDSSGRVGLNFGPLNQHGGERRLNVAITRARRSLLVFASLRAEQIDLARTLSVGLADLKQFLAFAEQGSRTPVPAAPPPGEAAGRFEASVAELLRARGWGVQMQIGVSAVRIDLGVVDPDVPGSFLAGVECDGAAYRSSASARDRDRLRQAVLEGLGWRILRVWSVDWWTRPAREADRLHAALQAALAEAREARAGLAAAPRFSGDGDEPRLAGTIEATLAAARGPLPQARLVQLVARAHGWPRAGRDIQARILAAIPPGCAQSRDDAGVFVWPVGVAPAACNRFRPPPAGESRDPAEIPLEELTVLARECLRDGADEAVALAAMRAGCGLQRLREAARQRCRQAIAAARSQG